MIVLILSIILAGFIVLFGFIVLISSTKKLINKLFFLLSIFVSLWVLFYGATGIFSSQLANRFTDLFGILSISVFLLFAFIFPQNDFPKLNNMFVSFILLFNVIIGILILFTSNIIAGLRIEDGVAVSINGKWLVLFIMFLILFVIGGVSMLIYKFFITYRFNDLERRKIQYVLFGCGLSGLLSIVLVITSLFSSLPVTARTLLVDAAPFSVILLVLFTAYGILKGGLFDVRLAIVRSVTYSLLIVTLAGLYAGSTFAISSVFRVGQTTPAQIAINVAISLVLVFLFQPLRKFFDRITNRIFYKDNYNSDEFFGRLNKTLAVTTDLRELLKQTAKEIGTTLKSSQAFFYIYTNDQDHHISAGTLKHTDLSNGVITDIKQHITEKPGIIVATILDDNDEIKQVLTTNKIEIVLPLIKDKEIVGFLCLGENMGSNYTERDILVLNTISNELIIAVQNALSVQEIRDFNVTLKREIAAATQELRIKNALLKKLDKAKDEFVSMASHQLRTPLTSVKGYLSMVIEGDAGKLSKNQKDLLDQAFVSNEKMVHLVNDFLNVSRIQTGKFMLDKIPTDLAKVVTEEIDGLRQNAKARNLNLVLTVPKKLPMLNIDEGKIRQVVMNFADNALYYSNANTDINVNLAIDGDEVVYTVKDTGIGVPVSEQAQLFTKFYRASNARKQRPDGTGVGLYLAKKIVTAHDGKIVFETVEGKGSTFGFRLPIKELEVSSEEAYNLKD